MNDDNGVEEQDEEEEEGEMMDEYGDLMHAGGSIEYNQH